MFSEEKIYGIQAFDRPEEAFALLSSNWSVENEANMAIVNGNQFVRFLGARIIKIIVNMMLGKVSKDQCYESLGLADKTNDYMLDWNFFLYHNGRFYTSLMEFKDDFCYLWCDRQWDIFQELYETFNFDKLVDLGFEFVERHRYLIERFGDDGLKLILEEYWNN